MAQYGIPYQGSKDKLVHKIAALLPKAEHFYDLFGGGFSVSHFMYVHKKYPHVHYNEIEPSTVKLVQDAIDGKYNYNVFKPKWISREDFFANLDDGYTRIIWSFGNNQKGYIFGEKRHDNIRSLHNVVVFDEWDDNAIEILGRKSLPKDLSIRGRRLAVRKIIVSRLANRRDLHELEQLERLERLQQLEQLERLQQLEQLQQLERLELTSLSYDQVEIKPNSIIYCDPPYKGTAKYTREFDHDKFWNWVRNNPHPVFISEYTAPPDIKTIAAFRHQKTNSQTSTASVEKLFCNKAAELLMRSAKI